MIGINGHYGSHAKVSKLLDHMAPVSSATNDPNSLPRESALASVSEEPRLPLVTVGHDTSNSLMRVNAVAASRWSSTLISLTRVGDTEPGVQINPSKVSPATTTAP